MININVMGHADAALELSRKLKDGSRVMRDGVEWFKLRDPAVIEFQHSIQNCPRYLSLGDPFKHLLGSFAWMFSCNQESHYPDHLTPECRMPPQVTPSAITAKVIANGRVVLSIGDFLATFESTGTPDNLGVLDLNMVCSVQSSIDSIVPWSTRFGMLHQAVAGCSGLMMGSHRIFIMHPCAPVSVVEGVLAEEEEVGHLLNSAENMGASLPVIAGDYNGWLSNASMFIHEHCRAAPYNDRFIRRVLSPAMAAWLCLTDGESSDQDRVSKACAQINSVADPEWRFLLKRFCDMQIA